MLGRRTAFYFCDYKFAIEVDELDHCDRNIDYETKRQNAIRKSAWL